MLYRSFRLMLFAVVVCSVQAGEARLTAVSRVRSGAQMLDAEQTTFLTLINAYRARNGAGPLRISPILQTSSQWMADDLAAHNAVDHTDSLGRRTGARLADFGYEYSPWGENNAAGYNTAQTVFEGWKTCCDPDASGACTYAHRRNMLNPSFKAIGIGRASAKYWVTDFGGFVEQDPALRPTPMSRSGAISSTSPEAP